MKIRLDLSKESLVEFRIASRRGCVKCLKLCVILKKRKNKIKFAMYAEERIELNDNKRNKCNL